LSKSPVRAQTQQSRSYLKFDIKNLGPWHGDEIGVRNSTNEP
jgi:hypothetical protein